MTINNDTQMAIDLIAKVLDEMEIGHRNRHAKDAADIIERLATHNPPILLVVKRDG